MDRKFESKYLADTKITAAQFLSEKICERIAKKEGATLPVKFWNTKRWGPIFKRQIVAANHLLEKYELKDILAALNTKKAAWIISLGAKSILEPIIVMMSESKPEIKQVSLEIDLSRDIFEEVDNVLTDKKKTRSVWEKLNG